MQMLVKSFIDNDTINELLNWSNTQNIYQNVSNGKQGYYSRLEQLSNIPKIVNDLRNKCRVLVSGIYQEPIYKDFVNEIFPTGYVSNHKDGCFTQGYKHLRCNILLQKPEIGGCINIEGNDILMNVGDLCVVDTHKIHGINIINGNISFKSISFGFLCYE